MLAQSSRRPKVWTYTEKIEDRTVECTILFDGCPFKLKSSGMVDWLWALLLWQEATTPENHFTADELLEIGFEYIVAQLDGNFWVFEPTGFVQQLTEWMVRLEKIEDEHLLLVWLKDKLVDKLQEGELPEEIYWECRRAVLLCWVYIIDLSIKVGQIAPHTIDALASLQGVLEANIEEAKEANEYPGGMIDCEYFELLIKMIPEIESSGDKDSIRGAYLFFHTFIQY